MHTLLILVATDAPFVCLARTPQQGSSWDVNKKASEQPGTHLRVLSALVHKSLSAQVSLLCLTRKVQLGSKTTWPGPKPARITNWTDAAHDEPRVGIIFSSKSVYSVYMTLPNEMQTNPAATGFCFKAGVFGPYIAVIATTVEFLLTTTDHTTTHNP